MPDEPAKRKRGDYTLYTEEQRAMVIKNTGLVKKVISDRFLVYSEWYEDMYQEGIIGLIKAASRYDPSKGAQLSTFAYLCVKNEIQKFVSECTDAIKVPVSVRLAIKQVSDLRKEGASEAEINEAIKYNQISRDMHDAGIRASNIYSLDAEMEEDSTLLDSVAADEYRDPMECSREERQLYSDLHKWLNYMNEGRYVENRIYMDYLYEADAPDFRIVQFYAMCRDLYEKSRNDVQRILKEYTPMVQKYLQKRKQHC